MNRTFAALFISTLLSGCATQPALMKPTMSGKPEATFRNASVDLVRNEIVLGCAKVGARVDSQQYTVTCAVKPSDGRAFAAELLLGNACTHDPLERMQFTLVPAGNDVFVTATGWLEVNRCFGDIKRVEYDNNNFRNQVQAGLDRAVANYEAKYLSGAVADAAPPPTAGLLPAAVLTAPSATPSQPAAEQRWEPDPAKRCDACQRLKVPR